MRLLSLTVLKTQAASPVLKLICCGIQSDPAAKDRILCTTHQLFIYTGETCHMLDADLQQSHAP